LGGYELFTNSHLHSLKEIPAFKIIYLLTKEPSKVNIASLHHYKTIPREIKDGREGNK